MTDEKIARNKRKMTEKSKINMQHNQTQISKLSEIATSSNLISYKVKSDDIDVTENGEQENDDGEHKPNGIGNAKEFGRTKKKKKMAKKRERVPNNDEMKTQECAKHKPQSLPKQDQEQSSEIVQMQKAASVSCFGFITNWLTRRKEKKREKKRRAIQARSSNTKKTKLNECERKKSRGGLAFTIELERSRPIKKPLFPPIKTKSGPLKLGHDEKLQNAEKIRKYQLEKKVSFVRSQEERRIENTERKADNERGFRRKTALTMIAKQRQAKRNQSRIEMNRRCGSAMRCLTPVVP